MAGSRDNIYDLTDHLNKSNADYFILLVDIPRVKKKDRNKDLDLNVAIEKYTTLTNKTDHKKLLECIIHLPEIHAPVKSKIVTQKLNLLLDQKFNYFYLNLARQPDKKKQIIGVKEFSMGVQDEECAAIFQNILAGAAQEIIDHYNLG